MDRTRTEFERFVREVEPRLRRALVAGFGAQVGRQAAADALTWSWENWAKARTLANPAGYLYKVGRTAALRAGGRDVPAANLPSASTDGELTFEPALMPALRALSAPQRTAVLLVHGYGYTLRDAAELIGVTASTIHRDCDRALSQLRAHLEVEDVH